MQRAIPDAAHAVATYKRTNVRLLRNCTGNKRRSGVVKMLKVDCRAKEIRETPKRTQRVIGPAELQAQDDPEKVAAIIKRQKVDAFNTAPTQSILASFSFIESDVWGL